jgi:hypothetical protein
MTECDVCIPCFGKERKATHGRTLISTLENPRQVKVNISIHTFGRIITLI